MKLLFTIAEAAEACSMSEGAIKKAIHSGALRSGKFGRSRRILFDDLRMWVGRIIVVTSAGHGQLPTDSRKNQVVEKTLGARS